MPTVADLILEVTEKGYDVEIRLGRRDDGQPGRVTMPNDWARRLGLSDQEIDRLRAEQRR